MAVIDTTNVLESTSFLKAKFPHNKVGSNYFIQNLQAKRDEDWQYRPNIVDIEEELEKQIEYTTEDPLYTPVDVAIRSVKSEKGQDLGSDWADIAFQKLNHFNTLGGRYRFDTEFPDISLMTEEEKHYNTSIWICINKSPINQGNNCIIRRCNSSLVFVGSPDSTYDNITETHIEPVILDNDLKYINIYYNMTTVVPQAEWYATMQMNYFTNNIKVNDRFIFGGVDLTDRENNAVYKVKAVVKSASMKTFSKEKSNEIKNIPLVLIAMDKDVIDAKDDFVTRIANMSPIYRTKPYEPYYEYYIKMCCEDLATSKPDDMVDNVHENGIYHEDILFGETVVYTVNLYWNKNVKPIKFDIKANLELGKTNKNKPEDYFKLEILSDNTFAITNLKSYVYKPLIVTCSCVNPTNEAEIISQDFEITLRGFY